ncbi:hypothetical protein B0H10DRAFT_2440171 [Mycena sp. CBHHK59/15]|nr:hypothetical protein B0H10DRAFT_2440171 [Mycena sp. CBHHK59/15]
MERHHSFHPALWTTVRVNFLRDKEFPKLMEFWLARSRNHHSLSLHDELDPDVRNAVRQNTHRIRTLEMYVSSSKLLLKRTLLPALKAIKIGAAMGKHLNLTFKVVHCAALLHAAPNLEERLFHGLDFHDATSTPPASPARYPSLKCLRPGGLSRIADNSRAYIQL